MRTSSRSTTTVWREADIVGLTGMIVQRRRMREILRELKARGVFTVVGGPWVSVQEDYFDGLADVIFVGEAETTWPQFLDEWTQGRHQHRYEQLERTDMTRVPVPRYDLLKTKDYVFGSIQFSRGCPFQCEFCDIIVMFGRKPRLKTSAQVIAELEAMRKQHLLDRLHRRRQPDRQQDRGEEVAARRCRVAGRRGISLHVLH